MQEPIDNNEKSAPAGEERPNLNADHAEIQPEENKKIPLAYAGWVSWTRSQANKHLNSTDPEERIRAIYRIGQIEQDEGNNEASLVFFKQVRQKNADFCADIVSLRIAEVSYKLNLIDQAFEAIEVCERVIKQKDLYMVHMLKGKCFDRLKQY